MAARAAGRAPGVVARGDALRLPIQTGSLDGLYLTFPAQYVRDRLFWGEAARVLKVGGRMRIILDAGPAYASSSSFRLEAPSPGWRLRKARVAVGGATLGVLLARRVANDERTGLPSLEPPSASNVVAFPPIGRPPRRRRR